MKIKYKEYGVYNLDSKDASKVYKIIFANTDNKDVIFSAIIGSNDIRLSIRKPIVI